MRSVALACVLTLAPALVSATSEVVVQLSRFQVESTDNTCSSAVRVTGVSGSSGIERLEIDVFDKNYNLSGSQLKKLHNVHFNGVLLSCEGRKGGQGGRTLHVIFAVGFSAGSVLSSNVVDINDGGQVSISSLK